MDLQSAVHILLLSTSYWLPFTKYLSPAVPNLLLVNTTPSMDGSGIVLHLREVEGLEFSLDIRRLREETGAVKAEEVSVLGEYQILFCG